MIRIGMNLGFITNSSSCVHHVPRSILEDPEIAAFLKAFGVEDGFVGSNLWNRAECSSLILTEEQVAIAEAGFSEEPEFSAPRIIHKKDEFTIIYGDEHESIARTLMGMIEKKIGHQYGDEYN